MTNAELIATIRNEIERRITDNTFGAKLELIDILAWLDTLESEKPANQDEDLNEGIKKFIEEYGYERGEDKLLIAIVARHFAEWGYLRAAEKYNEIEYNRQRAEENASNDLEEAAHSYSESDEPLYSPGHRFHWDSDSLFGKQIETTFIAGAEWQAKQLLKGSPMPEDTVLFNKGVEEGKEQMMKGAIEATLDNTAYPTRLWFNTYLSEYSNGEKVRIIIVKED